MAEVKIITLDLLNEYNKLKNQEINKGLNELKNDITNDIDLKIGDINIDLDNITTSISNVSKDFNRQLESLTSRFATLKDSVGDVHISLTSLQESFLSATTSLDNRLKDLPANLRLEGFITASTLSSTVVAAGYVIGDDDAINSKIDNRIVSAVPSWALQSNKPNYLLNEIVDAPNWIKSVKKPTYNISEIISSTDEEGNVSYLEVDLNTTVTQLKTLLNDTKNMVEGINSNFTNLNTKIKSLETEVVSIGEGLSTMQTNVAVELNALNTKILDVQGISASTNISIDTGYVHNYESTDVGLGQINTPTTTHSRFDKIVSVAP